MHSVTFVFITVKEHDVEVHYGGHEIPISSIVDLDGLLDYRARELGCRLDDLRVYCSSSLDSPEEYTSNPNVIALARAIREG